MHDTLAIARQFAALHPEASLPCPSCAASLKARNLDRHLAEVHQLGPQATLATSALRGVDGRAVRVLVVPLLLWCLAVGVLGLLQTLYGLELGDASGVAAVVLLVAAGLPPLLASLNLLRAELVLGERQLELRYCWGLLRLQVALPVELEHGGWWGNRQAAGMHQHEHSVPEAVRFGGYLRLKNANSSLIVGSRKSAQLRQHWDGASTGPRQRRCDLALDVTSMVALQYYLAARGLLRPN